MLTFIPSDPSTSNVTANLTGCGSVPSLDSAAFNVNVPRNGEMSGCWLATGMARARSETRRTNRFSVPGIPTKACDVSEGWDSNLHSVCANMTGHVSPTKSFVEATGQLRRLRASVWIIVVLGFLLVVLIKQMAAQADMSTALFVSMLITLTAQIAVATWACITIRCPRCRARLIWMAVRQQSMSRWMNWLRTQTTCPVCHFRPEDS